MIKQPVRTWTAEEEGRLKDLWLEGKEASQIAVILGRSRPSVTGRIVKRGMMAIKPNKKKRNAWTEEQEQKLMTMWKEGSTAKEICAALGWSESAIRNKITESGYRRHHIRYRGFTPEEDERAIDLVIKQNKTYAEASVIMGKERGSLAKRLQKLGFQSHRPAPIDDHFKRRIVELRRSGMMIKEVAEALGVSKSIVARVCGRMKLGKYGSRPWTGEDLDMLKLFVNNEMDPETVIEKLRRPWHNINQKMKQIFPSKSPKVKKFIFTYRYSLDSLIADKLKNARARNRTWNRPFDIDEIWIREQLKKQNWQCHYTGIKFRIDAPNGDMFTLERINSNKGYTKDNVVLAIWDINLMKQHLPIDRFFELCNKAVERLKGQQIEVPSHCLDSSWRDQVG